MIPSVRREYLDARLSEREFKRLGAFIQTRTGIKMPPHKKEMLESRLRKRLRSLRIPSYKDYCHYLFSTEGMKNELVHMIDVVTTNKTDFFREPDHFDFLRETVLPEMLNGRYRRISVWSAACSTGEEPYTLAMVLETFSSCHPDNQIEYNILATDISAEALKKAETGIFNEDLVKDVPMEYKKEYLLRSKERKKKLIRIIPRLRNRVAFHRMNLMADDFNLAYAMDIIFCRNVIIYFEKQTQEKLLKRICRYLKHGGYLFMGHTEALGGFNLPLVSVSPTVYRKIV